MASRVTQKPSIQISVVVSIVGELAIFLQVIRKSNVYGHLLTSPQQVMLGERKRKIRHVGFQCLILLFSHEISHHQRCLAAAFSSFPLKTHMRLVN